MVAKTQRVSGIVSKIDNDEHIILWDLDDCNLSNAIESLKTVQDRYSLSDIYIVSDKKNSYGAICLTIVDFSRLLRILIDTAYIDMGFVAYTAKRYGATLRLSPKKDRGARKIVYTIPSEIKSDFRPINTVVYDTGLIKNGLMIGNVK
jgi:hypothetical protein